MINMLYHFIFRYTYCAYIHIIFIYYIQIGRIDGVVLIHSGVFGSFARDGVSGYVPPVLPEKQPSHIPPPPGLKFQGSWSLERKQLRRVAMTCSRQFGNPGGGCNFVWFRWSLGRNTVTGFCNGVEVYTCINRWLLKRKWTWIVDLSRFWRLK